MKINFLTNMTSEELNQRPISPGTIYFTLDRCIYFDTSNNVRLCMDNFLDEKIAKVDPASRIKVQPKSYTSTAAGEIWITE